MSEWELICGHAWKAQFANSAFFVGFLVGAGVFGMLSDRYGESEAWSRPAVASIAQVTDDPAAEPAWTVRWQDALNTAAILYCLAGRKVALLSSCAVAAVFGIASSLSPGYW